MLLPFLLFSFLIFSTISDTLFVFNGAVTCHLNRPFNYHIQVVEEDVWYDDYISTETYHEAKTSPSFYNITAVDGDDGWFNKYYEILFFVTHDCNSADLYKHLWVSLPVGLFEINHGTHYRTFNFDLTDLGSTWSYNMGRRKNGMQMIHY